MVQGEEGLDIVKSVETEVWNVLNKGKGRLVGEQLLKWRGQCALHHAPTLLRRRRDEDRKDFGLDEHECNSFVCFFFTAYMIQVLSVLHRVFVRKCTISRGDMYVDAVNRRSCHVRLATTP